MYERTLYLGCDSIEHHPGNKCVLESWFEETPYGIVFENDGDTGYFYAAHAEQGILDALHIYNIKDVTRIVRSFVFRNQPHRNPRYRLLERHTGIP